MDSLYDTKSLVGPNADPQIDEKAELVSTVTGPTHTRRVDYLKKDWTRNFSSLHHDRLA